MCLQTACQRGCIVTLVTLVWLFSTVYFQMCLQGACIEGCIVTLVAFVWLFSTVCLQMHSQIAWIGWCIVTQFAFISNFSTVWFHVCLQMVCMICCKTTVAAFVWLLFISWFVHWKVFIGTNLTQIIAFFSFSPIISMQDMLCPTRIDSNWEKGKGKTRMGKKKLNF